MQNPKNNSEMQILFRSQLISLKKNLRDGDQKNGKAFKTDYKNTVAEVLCDGSDDSDNQSEKSEDSCEDGDEEDFQNFEKMILKPEDIP